MTAKFIALFAVFGVCSCAVVTKWPPTELESLYHQHKQERTYADDVILAMGEPERALLCAQVLNANFFKDAGIEYVRRGDSASRVQLLREEPAWYGLYYRLNDPKNRTIYPVITQTVAMSNPEELFTVPCLGRDAKTETRPFKEFFVSDGFKKHTFFLSERNGKNVELFGLVEMEPGFSKMSSQNRLEEFYVRQREEVVTDTSDPAEENVLRTLSPFEKYRLASLVFNSNLFRGVRNGKIDGPAFDMQYELETKPIKFTNGNFSGLNWTADVLIVFCPICVPNKPRPPPGEVGTPIMATMSPKKFFIGRTYNGEDATVFIFREDEKEDKIVLDSYVFGLTVLSKS